jgi:hypothetical protein
MMRDAGIDMDAIMLYEADERMFAGLVGQWGAYAKRDQLNIIVGDTIDWNLHQKTLNPSGPESFIDRTLRAARGFHTDGKPVRGAFFHDIIRAIWGRKGPYRSIEWMLAAGHAITEIRRLNDVLPYDFTINVSTTIKPGEETPVTVAYRTEPSTQTVTVRLFAGPDLESSASELKFEPGVSSATFKVRWKPDEVSASRANRTFIALRASRSERPSEHPVIRMVYVQGDAPAPVPVPAPEGAAPAAAPTGPAKEEAPKP